VPPGEVDNLGGSASGGREPSGDGDDSGDAESGGRSSGGRASGGRSSGSGGDQPGSGGDEPGSGGEGGMGGDPGGSTGGQAPVDPGDLRFDLPVKEEGLPSGFALIVDLDGDGHRDARFVDIWSMSGQTVVHFALADGLGGYTEIAPIIIPGSSGAGGSFGDFNADGVPDLVLGGVRPGLGDGTFGAPITHGGGRLADFNEDGRDDGLVLRGSNTPNSVLNLTNEDMTSTEIVVPFFGSNQDIALGDFDGDGHLDLADIDQVRRGNGDGTFGALLASDCSCSDLVEVRAVADLNDDGRDDLVLGYPHALYVLLGQEDGSLSLEVQYEFDWPTDLVVGDLDDDGHLDLVAEASSTLDVLYGDGAGKFVDRKRYLNTNFGETAPAIEDRDGDGVMDVVLDGSWIALGRGERRLRAAELSFFAPAGSGMPAVARLSATGPLQVASALNDARLHRIPFGTDRYLQTGEVCNGPGSGMYRSVLDMTGDGLADVVSFSGDLNLWVGQGGCSFAAATPHAFSGYSVWFFPFNDDDLLDVVYRASNGLGITVATGPGTFASPVISPFGGFESSITAADLNGDSYVDVVVADHEDLEITILLSDENYQLSELDVIDLEWNEAPYLKSADIDHDGDVDVLMGLEGSPGALEILRNDGDAGLTREHLADIDTLAGFEIGDVDNDGLLEVVTDDNQQLTGIYRVGPTAPATRLGQVSMPRGGVLRDVDADGDLDLVTGQSGWVAVGNNLTVD